MKLGNPTAFKDTTHFPRVLQSSFHIDVAQQVTLDYFNPLILNEPNILISNDLAPFRTSNNLLYHSKDT